MDAGSRASRWAGDRRRAFGALIATAAVGAALCLGSPSASAAPGDLDPSFGDGGQIAFPLSLRGAQQVGRPKALMLTPGGEIELAGTASPPQGSAWRAFAARLLEGGALDPSFGSGGSVVSSLPPSDEGPGVLTDDGVEAAALEPDGAVVVVGPRTQGRLTAGGVFDDSFETGNPPLAGFALAYLPGGEILAAGETPTEGSGPRHATLERLQGDGRPDPTFGSGGLVQLPNRAGAQVRESARSVLALEDGDLLLAGVGAIGEGAEEETYDWLARVTPDGSLDATFGQGGVQYVPAVTAYQGERGVTLAREPDGVIVLSGNEPTGAGHWQAAAWGFLPDGSLDASFGTGGVTSLAPLDPGATSQATTVTTDGEGNVYVAVDQESRIPPYHPGSFVARLTSTGQLDGAYGSDGVVTVAPATVSSLAVDRAGRLTLAGERGEEVFVARLLAGAAPAPPPSAGTGAGASPGATTSSATANRRSGKVLGAVASSRGEQIGCHRVAHMPTRRSVERCTLTLSHLHGRWKSALVRVRSGHRLIAQRRLRGLGSTATLRLLLPGGERSTTWTVTLFNGKHHLRTTRTVPV
jgi:uncharacterized delta-60 repeat protein